MKQNIFSVAGILLLIGGIITVYTTTIAASSDSSSSAKIGEAAPNFSIPDETGKIHSLPDYKGKTVILEWTNQDCPYVKKHYERKTFNAMYKKLDTSKVAWLAINSTHYNTSEMSQKAKKTNNLPYPILQDPAGKVGALYGAKTTPHMYIIDSKGLLQYSGALDNDPWGEKAAPVNYIEEALPAVMAGKSPARTSTTPYGCSVKYAK